VESICDYFHHLTDNGVLYIARENGVKLFTTVLAALDRLGVEPAGRIYMEHGLSTYNHNALLVRKNPFPRSELEVLANHLRRWRREVFFAPAELYEILGPDWRPEKPDENCRRVLEAVYRADEAERDRFIASLGFNAVPPTDDKPFFNRAIPFFSRIDSSEPALPGEIKQMARDARKFGPVPIGDVPGVAVLGEAILLAGVVIFLPLRRLGSAAGPRGMRAAFLVYFSLLGAGFIALEIVLLQRYILFIGSPTISMAVVLGSLLVSAGLGSMLLSPVTTGRPNLALALFLLIGLLAYLYGTQLEAVFGGWLRYGLLTRCALGVALLLPLGLLLGMPFPTGLRYASRQDERLVAWGWALNGYMTVIGTTSVSILIQFLGYKLMFIVGGVIYLAAGICFLVFSHRVATDPLPHQAEHLTVADERGRHVGKTSGGQLY
jgi:hypothetical protein